MVARAMILNETILRGRSLKVMGNLSSPTCWSLTFFPRRLLRSGPTSPACHLAGRTESLLPEVEAATRVCTGEDTVLVVVGTVADSVDGRGDIHLTSRLES